MMRSLAAALLLLVQAAGQPRNDDILGVREWWGQVSIRAVTSGSRDGRTWDLEETLYVQVHIDTAVNAPWFLPPNPQELLETGRYGGWFNTKPGSIHQVHRVRGTTVASMGGGRTQTMRWNGSDIGPSAEGLFHFQVDLKRKVYLFSIPGPLSLRPAVMQRESVEVIPGHPTNRQDLSGPLMGNGTWGIVGPRPPEHNLPASGMNLRGSLRLPYKLTHSHPNDPPVEAVVDWTISPKPPPPLQLEIEAKPDGGVAYADWRPRPGPDETTPGSFLDVTARLVTPPGVQAEKVSLIRMILTDVSEERGVSLNYPPGAEGRDPVPDFGFDPLYNRDVFVSERRTQEVPRGGADLRETKARVAFFDGGAWGELMAEAIMESGRYVLGHVKGFPDQRTLLIPKRRPESKIADAWRSPGADDDDPDNLPAGDGQPGDGLTNYEEYRGFHVQGAWTEGDPQKKEFFVRNEAGGMAEGGISLFERITRLRVHRLAARELSASRIVNAARTVGPTKVEQHAVIVRSDPALGQRCTAVTDNRTPGMPKHVSHVGLGQMPGATVATVNFATGQTRAVSYDASTIAHELLHCCNVWHHGDPASEKDPRVWDKSPDGRIVEEGMVIRVVNEAGQDISGQLTYPLTLSIYTKGGVASGDISCVMRYDDGWVLEDPAKPGVRVLLAVDPNQTGEVTGSSLCTRPAATGTNTTRFGAATRGNCAGQIVVSDAATRTTR